MEFTKYGEVPNNIAEQLKTSWYHHKIKLLNKVDSNALRGLEYATFLQFVECKIFFN
jgi:hypothetical protein